MKKVDVVLYYDLEGAKLHADYPKEKKVANPQMCNLKGY
jgi:hypothetical protein